MGMSAKELFTAIDSINRQQMEWYRLLHGQMSPQRFLDGPLVDRKPTDLDLYTLEQMKIKW